MKKAIIRIAVLILFSAAAVASVMLLNRYYTRPITVKTPLVDGEIIERVELSRGELWFKDEETLVSQLTQEDYLFVTGISVKANDTLVPYTEMNGGKSYSREELLAALNIYPEYWTMGGMPLKDTDYQRLWVQGVCFINGDPEKPVYMFNGAKAHAVWYTYPAPHNHDININIYASPTPVKCSLDGVLQYTAEMLMSGAGSVRAMFGDMDSVIGDIPAAVCVKASRWWSAFFIIGETAYQVSASNCTQAEFIELILSICNAPHPEKENYIDFLLK